MPTVSSAPSVVTAELSERLAIVWGKTACDGSQGFHPLLCHLLDAGAVAAELWDRVMCPDARARIADDLGVDEPDAGRWVALLAASHDLGKATPGFQARASERVPALRDRGLAVGNAEAGPAHGTLSAVLARG